MPEKLRPSLQWSIVLRSLLIFALLAYLCTFKYDQRIFQFSVYTACCIAALLILGRPTKKIAEWLEIRQEGHFTRKAVILPLSGVYAILLATLGFLEWQQPYYFVQEDTHALVFPVILQAARGLFNEGVFPTWNGYQLLGVPTTTLGYYSLSYPFTYLSYALARFLFGNEYLTLEIFALLHLSAGYFFTFILLRILHVRPFLSAAAALGFVLLGFNLIAGRSWHNVVPTVAYLPALGLLLTWFIHHAPTRNWCIATALVIGLYFHAGHIQMWFYGISFWILGITWLLISKKQFWQYIRPISLAGTAGLALALPLLVAQIMEMRNIPRPAVDASIANGLSNMLLPWPLATSPATWGDHFKSGTLFFGSGIFIFFFMLHGAFIAAFLAKGTMNRMHWRVTVFPLLAILAFVLALGSQGQLWNWLQSNAVLSHFRMPFRLLPFTVFFMTISGAMMAEAIIRRIPGGKAAGIALAIVSCGFSAYNASNCQATFGFCPDHPYSTLPASYKSFQSTGFSSTGRILPFSRITRDHAPNHTLTLIKGYPSLYSILSASGQYPMNLEAGLPINQQAEMRFRHHPVQFIRAYSVRWLLVSKLPGETEGISPRIREYLHSIGARRYDLDALDLFDLRHDDRIQPMAFLQIKDLPALPYRLRTNGVDIDTKNVTNFDNVSMIVNFLYRPWFYAEDSNGKSLNTSQDHFGRLIVKLSAPTDRVALYYSPPWHYGLLIGLGIVLLSFLLTHQRLWKFIKGI